MNLQKMVKVAIMAAVLCIICPISINIGTGVPITLGTFGVYLVSGLLGPLLGSLTVLLYLILGALGLPVFAGFSGGLSSFFAPSGGYLMSFLPMAWFIGFFVEKFSGFLDNLLAMIGGTILCYTFGTIFLMHSLNLNLQEGLLMGVVPYLFFDSIKVVSASFICSKIHNRIPINIDN